MGIEALCFHPSYPLCYVMLCGLFCFVFTLTHFNISSIVLSFGKTLASTAIKHYHSQTVFRETYHPGKWPSGKHLNGKRLIREKDYPGNVSPGK